MQAVSMQRGEADMLLCVVSIVAMTMDVSPRRLDESGGKRERNESADGPAHPSRV